MGNAVIYSPRDPAIIEINGEIKDNGKIWLESKLDHGTKFYIGISVKQGENAQEDFIRRR